VNPSAEISQWLFEEFSSRLSTVFESMVGDRPRIDIEQVQAIPADAALCWRQPFSGVAGILWITASVAAWKAAGGHVLRAAGIEENDAASLKSTYLETLSQALSGIAAAMGARLGREVNCTRGEELSPAAVASMNDGAWAVLRIKLGAEAANIAIGLDPSLVLAMAASSPTDASTTVIAGATTEGFAGPVNSKTFELLLDVELPVSVSFGRAQVPLKDVLKLTTGSIVELNRSIHEPVEVIVNNCVIARGEVVVVEGNFGVRIHEVVSRRERLRTLN
jgi:flagellar motor switch protein FliN/FliY